MNILLLSDIHGNYPALEAIDKALDGASFDLIINAGDSTVYAPFADQVLDWLRFHQAVTILGNTDRKVVRLLRGKTFRKPATAEKRIMYVHTARQLSSVNQHFLISLKKKRKIFRKKRKIGLFHGSPDRFTEFLFADTPRHRFEEIAATCACDLVITGHSHTPYQKLVEGVLFINPGSVGRMFDGDPRASCAVLKLRKKSHTIIHHRIEYDVERVVQELRGQGLPSIYQEMYRQGRKLN